MNPNYRNFALWAIIALLLIALFNLFQSPAQRVNSQEIEYSRFLSDVDSGKVKSGDDCRQPDFRHLCGQWRGVPDLCAG